MPDSALVYAPAAFYRRDVLAVAEDLIGMTLLVDGVGGVIVETEAYDRDDPASHTFRGPTPRNAVMFGPPGHIYIYLSYGMHWCANIVSGEPGRASAVLLRALEPTVGLDRMAQRRGLDKPTLLCSGPGRLCQALGLTGSQNGLALTQPPLELLRRSHEPPIVSGPRIGISKAVERPWRFGWSGSKFLSKKF
ncbi:DNA-3-methyladenine glycosylase [Labrys neptuniae]|uniref:Putative 3-methyladenine DNA glycosylase n=1 Tax=Labrys neptuniae TaxID=376174 RepID=A0ABV3PRL2_9HYPH|nr:DNA-3-methyladenine glycosylase [Labrys neptuniae]MDT3379981.1 DNA-3-methyladenine glycosylase [Labrys neptuniae]